jgi:hypothetical protein
MVYISIYEAPEKKPELIEQAGRVIFLMSQIRHVSAFVEASNLSPSGTKALPKWRAELLANYRNDASRDEHPLIAEIDNVAPASSGVIHDPDREQLSGYLLSMDRLTRRVFTPHV